MVGREGLKPVIILLRSQAKALPLRQALHP